MEFVVTILGGYMLWIDQFGGNREEDRREQSCNKRLPRAFRTNYG